MAPTKYLNAKHGIEILHGDGTTQILAGAADPSVIGIDAEIGSIYLCSTISGALYSKKGLADTDWVTGGSTASSEIYKSYISLLDTPDTYEENIGKYPRVNIEGDGLDFGYVEFNIHDPEQPLIPDTAVSGTYFVNFEAGRLLIGATGAKPDLVYLGPIGGLAFSDKAREACYGSFKIPYSWHTESDIKIRINFMNDSTQTGITSCAWKMDFHTYASGELFTDKITSTIDMDFTLGDSCLSGTFQQLDLLLPPDDVNNPVSRGDIIVFEFYRDGLSVADTTLGDAILITLTIEAQTGQHILGDG